jgi:hypothetical protein
LGEPKIKLKDLTPEQQFEEKQRRKVPQVFKDDKDTVVDTNESVAWAEGSTGLKMAEPVKKKDRKKPVKYELADSDDEDDDTVETRKSVKTAEKALRKRFFINAREKRDYGKAMAEGKISERQLDFREDDDEELGAVDPLKKQREAAKKAAKVAALQEKIAERDAPKLNKEQLKEKHRLEREKEIADEIAKSKEDSPVNAAPIKKEVKEAKEGPEAPPLPPTPSDLPPELAGALPQAAAAAPAEAPKSELPPELAGALAQHRNRAYESDSDSDSDSESDSDSD